MANNRIAILVALEGADEGLKRAIASAERSLGELSSTAKSAGDKAAAGMAQIRAGMGALGEQIASAKTQLLAFLSINWAAGKVQELVQVADAWNQMNARLKLATAGSREYTAAQAALFDIAQRTGAPIQETATLYGKLQQAVRMLGGEQQDALSITESISQALRISGASAEESSAALLQFGQALASGVLRGEEFNSVVENSPRLAQALADGLNVPIGRLRKMAEEGRLSADVVVGALMGQKDKLAAEYAQLPATVSQAFTRLSNAFGQWVSGMDATSGMTGKLAAAMTWLAQNIDAVLQAFKRLAEVGLAVLAYRMIPALITALQTAGVAAVTAANASAAAWNTANLSVTAAVASAGLLKTAFAGLGAFMLGWEVGTWLSGQFETVRKAGIVMVEAVMLGIEHLRYQWEAFKALFTTDTLDQATQRHQARLEQMKGIFAQMYAGAERGAQAAQGAMNTAASAAEEINKKLQAVRQGTQEAVGRGVDAVHEALGKLHSRIGEVEQAVGKAQSVVSDATAKMAQAYKGLTSIIDDSLAQQVQALKARYDQEQAALDLTQKSETARITQSTQLLTEALSQQVSLRSKATTDTLALIEQESIARKDAAARQGQTDAERSANVTRVENEILATKRQTLTQALTEYSQHIDALNAQANRHLSEVQRIEQAKRQLSMTTDERIRDIQRQGMTDFEATEDRKRQIVELQTQARQALATGELEHARQLAQQAMDLAAQVATSQTSEAKRGEDARKQSEQSLSQVTQLEAQAREATRRQEYAQADELMRQADALRAELAQKAQAADAQTAQGKAGVGQAIDAIRQSEDILNKALQAEAQAHGAAAQAALDAREQIAQTLTQTQQQVDQLTAQLKDGLKLTLDADTSRLDRALFDLDKALADKQYLIKIQADLQDAQKQLEQYVQLLKDGQTLPIDADVTKARQALDQLSTYAQRNAQLELKVSSDKAVAAIDNVKGLIAKLGDIQTESRHLVSTNADAARAQIQSLNGVNTSSTHTIYVRKVEANATGGLAGAGLRRYATGGEVSSAFPRMAAGSVPGTGNQDSVPRTLDAGSFVLRKAAVQKYGARALARLSQIAHFATGGMVDAQKQNREVVEAQKTIELGLQGLGEYMDWSATHGGSLTAKWDTFRIWNPIAAQDRNALEKMLNQKTLTAHERQTLDQIKQRWRFAMAQPLVYGKDLERELITYMEQYQGQFFAQGGGVAPSDSVPAMLTPGEYVVNKAAVARFGAGFFEAINRLSVPAQALAAHAMVGVQGFATGGLVAAAGPSLPRPAVPDAAPTRTVRVELASGQQKVNATIDARDQARLLQLLDAARTRAV